LIGLYKAVRDFRPDKETSFRSFAELCVTRQIITAIKTATRYKHTPLNTYVSFSHTPAGQEADSDCTLGDALPGPTVDDPSICVISTEELQSLVFCLGTGLSKLEADALRLYLEGSSYEEMADALGCDTKTIDNALQRVKRKVLAHQRSRQVLS
jgi:RNA polymerase sporulation-specific sigma factor